MKSFLNNLVKTLNEDVNVSYTENGALGYCQSGKALLDMNFRVSSYRNKAEEDISNDFVKAFLGAWESGVYFALYWKKWLQTFRKSM